MQALLLIDLQNDFCSGGPLAIDDSDKAVDFANQVLPNFKSVVASQDWHPPHHLSFASSHPGKEPGDVIHLNGQPQILWPDHCVQNTLGAGFHPLLHLPNFAYIQQKGTHLGIDSYSTFLDNDQKTETGLHLWLKDKGIQELFILGLATDYCVKFSVLDALHYGFKVTLLTQGCFGVNLRPEDSKKALTEMQQAGAFLLDSFVSLTPH